MIRIFMIICACIFVFACMFYLVINIMVHFRQKKLLKVMEKSNSELEDFNNE